MLTTKLSYGLRVIIALMMTLAILSTAYSKPYSPYPENMSAKLIAVTSASQIDVSAETWPGFTRTFSISLVGIEVPQDKAGVKPCQSKLAKKALSFIKDYLKNANKIAISNMTMETSADQQVKADLITERGSLAQALLNQGLARSSTINPGEPWC